jgi:FkbM family methyltransferase
MEINQIISVTNINTFCNVWQLLTPLEIRGDAAMAWPVVKKALRTAQVQFPALVETKFSIHDRFFRSTGLLYKADYGGLRHFDLAGKLLLDVGAHRGQSTVAFRNAVKSPRIIAFEANPQLAADLAHRYEGDDSFSIEPVALCEADREIVLYVPYYKGFMFEGLASLKIEEARDWATPGRFFFHNAKNVSIEPLRVRGCRLDSFGLRPALIKLSIQRSEIEALMGAEETLKASRPIIMSAWPWPVLIGYLRDRGYAYYGYTGGRFVRGSRSYMNWFLLPEHEAQVSGLIAG